MRVEVKFNQIAVIPLSMNGKYHHRIYALTEKGDLVYNDVVCDDGEVMEPNEDGWYWVLHPETDVEEVTVVLRDFSAEDGIPPQS